MVNLGCGLSHYFQWLDNGQASMIDADLPEVIEQRLKLFGAPGERQQVMELDLCNPGCWDRLGLPASRDATPVLLICEGVLMYLQPAAVAAVFAVHLIRQAQAVLAPMTSTCLVLPERCLKPE